MKTTRIVTVTLLVMAMCLFGFTAYAAEPTKDNASALAGYTVTILDDTTPAVNVHGRPDDRSVMCFVSTSDQELGVMAHSDYNAIIARWQKLISLPGSGTYGAPPVEGKSWEEWFADEFNRYRGLDTSVRAEAVEKTAADTVEEFRQELVALVNEEREKAGLPAYIVSDECC